MASICWKIFTTILHLVCIFAATFCAFGCYSKYSEDLNSFDINFRKFNKNNNSIYPSVSICFTMPFINDRLNVHANEATAKNYSDFLVGSSYSEKLATIDYQNVSLQLKDFLVIAVVNDKSPSDAPNRGWTKMSDISEIGFNVHKSIFIKCFTFNVPFMQQVTLNSINIVMKRSVFPNSIRPLDGWGEPFGFTIFYHLPNQLFRSFSTVKRMWPMDPPKLYDITSYISNIEVLKRRQTKGYVCRDQEGYDDWLIQDVMDSVGCYPPYWNTTSSLPPCKTQQQFQEISKEFWDSFYSRTLIPPCKEMLKVSMEYVDRTSWFKPDDDKLGFEVSFRDSSFKEAKEKQAYDAQDLFGDIGGYVGLFLGYALVNLPDIFANLINFTKTKILSYRAKDELISGD